jgi:hypothetical protein
MLGEADDPAIGLKGRRSRKNGPLRYYRHLTTNPGMVELTRGDSHPISTLL